MDTYNLNKEEMNKYSNLNAAKRKAGVFTGIKSELSLFHYVFRLMASFLLISTYPLCDTMIMLTLVSPRSIL